MKSGSLIASRQATFEKTIAENEKRGSISKEFIANHNIALSNSLRSAKTDSRRRGMLRQPSVTENRKNFQSVDEIEDEFEKIMGMGERDDSSTSMNSSTGW